MTDVVASSVSSPNSPDYRSPAYGAQQRRWQLVDDMRDGLYAIRTRASEYMPRFESESPQDWMARVNMTFYDNYYAPTLTNDVGLVFAELPAMKGVSPRIEGLLDNIDGEGNKWHVFAQECFERGLHLGHAAIWTDFPQISPDQKRNLKTFTESGARPYMTLISADEIVSWRTIKIGGVEVLVQFVRKEETTKDTGAYGSEPVCQYRVYRQEVQVDASGKPTSLGAITWELYSPDTAQANTYTSIGTGTIVGPTRIPLRIFYGGEKVSTLHSKPFLIDLAHVAVELMQVKSDYAAVMHKCNVPTPVFSGLNPGEVVNMSNGISLPVGAKADYLEPKGMAINATQKRIADIKAELGRLGASVPAADSGMARMTATEAAQVARQRNARITNAAQSFEDAMNGALDDFGAYLKLQPGQAGTIAINREFAGAPVDPAFLAALDAAYKAGVITTDEYRYGLRHGELPEETDPVATQQILKAMQDAKTEAAAKADAAKKLLLAQAAQPTGGDPLQGDGRQVA